MDTMYNGRLHVDFAQARDDQYDWECHLRQLQREQRHREKIEQERSRIPSPPPVPHFNEGEANALVEKLKSKFLSKFQLRSLIICLELIQRKYISLSQL